MSARFISGETSTEDSLSLEELSNEFRMIQSGSKRIAIIGTRNLSITHTQLIETLSYALALSRNTIVTSGGSSGVNSAVIAGALKADPKLLEVVLPQTREQQPEEVRELLEATEIIEEHPERIKMDFVEASELCNREIIDSANQLICFLYHDSNTLSKAVEYAKSNHKIITTFYLD